MFKTIEDIKEANESGGYFWFRPDAMRFFSTRLSAKIHPSEKGGAYFISSERASAGSDGYRPARFYTVRYAADDGYVSTVGEFQGYWNSRAAHKAAAGYAVNGHDSQ